MNLPALDKFTAAIVEAVAHGMTTNPGAYASGLTAEQVGERMRAALVAHGAGGILITESIKVACKVYGIKPTKTAINEWIGYAPPLTGKKLKDAIAVAFKRHGNNVMFDMFDLSKIDREVAQAYTDCPSPATIDAAMVAAVAKYRKDAPLAKAVAS